MSFETHCSVIGHDPIPHGDCTTVCSRCGQYHRYDHIPRISDRVYVNKALAVMAYRKGAVSIPVAPKIPAPSGPFLSGKPAARDYCADGSAEAVVAALAFLVFAGSVLGFLAVAGWISL